MSNKIALMIGIGAEYKGKPAFKKANKDVLGLQSGVKSLAKAYIGLAGAQKAFRYGAASLKAFAADDKAARQLAKTVSNLGLAYENTNVANFIAGLEKTYHIADDFLRPAFAKLIQVTGSYTKSKELLTTALNASAGAGVDLTTTVQDLSQAYVGNLRGLRKYNLGLTQAELATMSFQQIQDKLNSTFAGQAALAADSYAGKIDALTIASNNAKEAIGKGLVDAIQSAFGSGDITTATSNIERMAKFVADLVAALGTAAKFSGFSLLSRAFGGIANKRNALATKDRKYDPMSGRVQDLSPAAIAQIKLRNKADADSAKRQKELALLTKKQSAAIKDQTALIKAKSLLETSSSVMNMDLIQNTAALMGKISADETLRLKLQQAILLGNSTEAGNLAQQLLASQIAAVKLSASDPLRGFTDGLLVALSALQQIRTELVALGAPKVAIPTTSNPIITGGGSSSAQGMSNISTNASFVTQANGVSIFTPSDIGASQARSTSGSNFTYNQGNPLAIEVFIDPRAATYGISAAVVANTANGNSNSATTIKSYAGGA